VIDRRSALQGLFASPFLLNTKSGEKELTAQAVPLDEKKKTLLVFKANTRLSKEALESIGDGLREHLRAFGITQPALLLPHEISLDVHEIG
jgi:hypothetical protein